MQVEIRPSELELGFPNVCSISGVLTTNRVRRHVWIAEREAISVMNALSAYEGATFATGMADYNHVPPVIFVPMSEKAAKHELQLIRRIAIQVIAVLALGVAAAAFRNLALAAVTGLLALIAIRTMLEVARTWPLVRFVSSDRLVISPVHPDFAKAILNR